MSKTQIRNEISKRERELKSASPERKITLQTEIEYLKFLQAAR